AVGVIDADLDRLDEAADLALDFGASFLQIVLASAKLVIASLHEVAARPALDVGQHQRRVSAIVIANVCRPVAGVGPGDGGATISQKAGSWRPPRHLLWLVAAIHNAGGGFDVMFRAVGA